MRGAGYRFYYPAELIGHGSEVAQHEDRDMNCRLMLGISLGISTMIVYVWKEASW